MTQFFSKFGIAALALAVLVALGAAPLAGAQGAGVPDIGGIYEMDGKTTVAGQPDQFMVAGKLVIRQDGVNCRISVDGTFRRVAGKTGPAGVALIGTGEAKLVGKKFSGKAEVQTLMSEVPGVDVAAAYMPKKFGPTLDAIAEGEVVEDGVIVFEIRSTLVGDGFTLPEGRKTVVTARRVARSAFELKTKKEKGQD